MDILATLRQLESEVQTLRTKVDLLEARLRILETPPSLLSRVLPSAPKSKSKG